MMELVRLLMIIARVQVNPLVRHRKVIDGELLAAIVSRSDGVAIVVPLITNRGFSERTNGERIRRPLCGKDALRLRRDPHPNTDQEVSSKNITAAVVNQDIENSPAPRLDVADCQT